MQLTPTDDRRRRAVVVSPHPDDSEIGAAGLVHRLAADDWDVVILVMTDEVEPGIAARRRAEMVSAAHVVGVPEDSVIFAGFPDGSLHASGEQLATLRKLVAAKGLQPDLVVVNHRAERHTDHKSTSGLIENVFVGVPTLEYVVGNHMDLTQFKPSVFVALDDQLLDIRRRAMAAHVSQVELGRIQAETYDRIQRSFSAEVGLLRAEPFETRNMSKAALRLIGPYNSSLFERLWVEAFDGDQLLVLHGSSPHLPHREALDDFRFAFRSRDELPVVAMRYADRPDGTGKELLASGNVLLVDGPVSNPLTARYLNHLGIRHRVTFTEPGPRDTRIRDCVTGEVRKPKFVEAHDGRRFVVEDVGVLTVMPNPYAARRILMAAAGATAVGTTGLLQLLMRPTREVLEMVSDGVMASHGVQGLFAIEVDDEGRLACRLLDVHSGLVGIDGVAGL